MGPRAEIKAKHEEVVLSDFVEYVNRRFNARYAIESRPEPPDAILRGGQRRRWVEMADIFFSTDYAHHILSFATPGERRHDTSGTVHFEVDGRLARQFVRVMRQKVTKKSYLPFRDAYGPGFLLLLVNHPWLDARTIHYMQDETRAASWQSDLGCFSSVFLGYRHGPGWAYKRWRYA